MVDGKFTVRHDTPGIDDYCRLRELAGLSPKAREAAEVGLANTLFGVQILDGGQVVGMGRVIGDGGCFFQVVDIAVMPEYQGPELGKLIMREIAGYIEREVPPTAYVSLLADGEAHRLYAQFGFALTAPKSVGMALKKE